MSLLIFYILLFSSNQPVDPPHGADFKISCSTCHSSGGWQLDKAIYSFDHSTTKLPLAGQHKEVSCKLCHPTLVFSEAKNECNQCHMDVHQATTGSDCSRCHTPVSWLVNNVNEIHRLSRFPLLGAHKTAECNLCHKSESMVRFDVPGINCIDCHKSTYMATSNPNHIQSGLSEDCVSCHPVNSFQWDGAGFNHNFFALVQGHGNSKCIDCHLTATASYAGLSQDCNSCHQKDFLATKNPDHTATKFSTSCKDCHSLSPGWKPANFDHTKFPLTLGHASPTCLDCHIGGNYIATPTDCYACHQKDYVSTTNPNHQTLNFVTNCKDCHTANPGWKPASYRQHDSQYFPIYSGRHHGVWNSCADCHANPSDYRINSCTNCHEHNKTDMDRKHQGEVSGYSYVSAECLRCHPVGNKE